MKNKREIIIAGISLLIGAIATFLLLNQFSHREKQIPSSAQIAIASPSIPANWKTYTNSRFGFSVKYPKNWSLGKEPDNGDGVDLYKDKSSNKVLVYGSNMSSSFSTQNDPVEREEIVLNDGRKATTLKLKSETGGIKYIMFFNRDGNNLEGKQYIFQAVVTEQFFKENEQILQRVAKSFTLSSGLDSAISRVKEEGYTVIDGLKTWDDSSESLNVLIGECAGAEGYCKKTFFFYNGEYLGTDTSDPSSQINFVWRNDTTIALNYVLYHKDDPMCCPTAGAITVRFKWDGNKLVALDPIPPLGGSSMSIDKIRIIYAPLLESYDPIF